MLTLAVGLVLAAVTFGGSPAQAHSALVSSDPADGSTVDALTSVTLTFNEDLVDFPDATAVRVTGPDGEVLDLADAWVLAGPSLTQTIGATEPGTYSIAWRVVSSDGHPISGTLSVTVSGGASTSPQPSTSPSATGAPSTSPSASPTASPSATNAPSASPSALLPVAEPEGTNWSLWAGIAAVLASAAVVGAITWMRRRH